MFAGLMATVLSCQSLLVGVSGMHRQLSWWSVNLMQTVARCTEPEPPPGMTASTSHVSTDHPYTYRPAHKPPIKPCMHVT